MIVQGILKQQVELDIPVESGVPINRDFLSSDEIISIPIIKNYKPRVCVWLRTPNGFALESLPTHIAEGLIEDILIISNPDGHAGTILIN